MMTDVEGIRGMSKEDSEMVKVDIKKSFGCKSSEQMEKSNT